MGIIKKFEDIHIIQDIVMCLDITDFNSKTYKNNTQQ